MEFVKYVIIYLSIGHDGGGPGVLARVLARALTLAFTAQGIKPIFVVDCRSNVDFDSIEREVTSVGGIARRTVPVTDRPLLWLPRTADTRKLDLDAIKTKVLAPFPAALEEFGRAFERHIRAVDERVGLVIGVVEPGAVHAARRMGIAALLIGDHLWDVTFERILEDPKHPIDAELAAVLKSIQAIAATATECFLWPAPVTPPAYYDAAVRSGARVTRLTGVIGTQAAAERLTSVDVRKYGIPDDGRPIACLTAGALGPLKGCFERVKAVYVAHPPEGYHVIVDQKPSVVFRSGEAEPLTVDRLRLDEMAVAAEIFFLRNGASTDTLIAARRPWVSLLEPGHWQVNAIAEAAEQMELAPILGPDDLAANPRDCIEQEVLGDLAKARRARARELLERIPFGAAEEWARTIMRRYLPMRIVLIAVNEDGYGPSSMLFHFIRALLSREPDYAIVLRVGTRVAFNERLYADILSPGPAPGRVCIESVHNLIQLVNQGDGKIDTVASLEAISRYPLLREPYLGNLPRGVKFAVECGVPTLARACHDGGIPCYTLFDHSWALTFRRILDDHAWSLRCIYRSVEATPQLEQALQLLEADEASTRKVFLFHPPLTPRRYWEHWQRLCPGRVASIGGMLGGALPGKEPEFRRQARRILNLPPGDERPVLLISAGGTGIWSQRLPALVEEYVRLDAARELDTHVFVFAGLDVEEVLALRAEIGPEVRYEAEGRTVAFRSILSYAGKRIPEPRVRLLRGARACTYQQIIAGVDFVLTRAGVVTIMDALATGVCILLVPQPGHAQVEEVHRLTVEAGLAADLPFDEFWKDPIATVNKAMKDDHRLADMRRKIAAFARNCEYAVVDQILRELP